MRMTQAKAQQLVRMNLRFGLLLFRLDCVLVALDMNPSYTAFREDGYALRREVEARHAKRRQLLNAALNGASDIQPLLDSNNSLIQCCGLFAEHTQKLIDASNGPPKVTVFLQASSQLIEVSKAWLELCKEQQSILEGPFAPVIDFLQFAVPGLFAGMLFFVLHKMLMNEYGPFGFMVAAASLFIIVFVAVSKLDPPHKDKK